MPSSVIKFFSYDEATKTLKIIFVTNMVYLYQNVLGEVYKMLEASGSKGRYFNNNIKDKFEFHKMEEE